MPQCVQSPGPSQPWDPFSDSGGEGEVSGRRGGHPGPPYASASVQRGDLVSAGASGK